MIFPNQPYYAIAWFCEGKYHGYCQRKDVKQGTINLEALFENDQFLKFDNEIKKGSNHQYFEQKQKMANHQELYFKSLV